MNLFKSFSVYFFVSMYQALLTFLSIVFFSHNMPVQDFGEYNLYLAITPFLLNFMIMGMTGPINVYYHKLGFNRFRLYFGQIIFYIVPLSLFLGLLLYLSFGANLAHHFNLNTNILFILVLLVFFQIFPQLLFTYYQTAQNPTLYAKTNFFYLTVNFLLSIGAFIIYKNIYSIFIVLLVSTFLFSIMTLKNFHLLDLTIPRFNKKAFVDVLHLGLPLIIHTTGATLLFMSDRFIVSYFMGNQEVAYYSVALQLSMILLILVNSFASGWGPYLFKELQNNKSLVPRHIVQKMYIFILVFFLMPFILYYLQMFILSIFFESTYELSMQYVLVIGLGYAAMGIYKVFIGFLHFAKRTKLIAGLTITALVSNLLFSCLFVVQYGTIGVAYGTFLSMLLLSGLTIAFVRKHYIFS